VPPGFTIVDRGLQHLLRQRRTVPAKIDEQMLEALKKLEGAWARSSATSADPAAGQRALRRQVLHAGHDGHHPQPRPERRDRRRPGQAKSNNPRFAYDCYRRFIQMYGNVVLEVPKDDFDEVFDGQKKKAKAKLDTDLTAEDLKEVIAGYKKLVRRRPASRSRRTPWNSSPAPRRRVRLLV
jgi:pyruvate,orthophosphate dikinase